MSSAPSGRITVCPAREDNGPYFSGRRRYIVLCAQTVSKRLGVAWQRVGAPPVTADRIVAVCRAKRGVHPELERQRDWPGIRRIMAREGVGLAVAPLGRPAKLVRFNGGWWILLNSRLHRRRYVNYAAHELAHLWLHVDGYGTERWEVGYNTDTAHVDAEQEEDAEYLASCMLYAVE